MALPGKANKRVERAWKREGEGIRDDNETADENNASLPPSLPPFPAFLQECSLQLVPSSPFVSEGEIAGEIL